MSSSFRTELTVLPQSEKLSQKSKVLTAGSCFAEVMGNKMAAYKLKSLVNPFGTIFNPLSLFKLFITALEPEKRFTGKFLERDGQWFAYDLHSSFSATSQDLLGVKIQERLAQTHTFLQNTDCLILTLGTAVGYVHKATNTLVANCHKVPQQEFQKQLISAAAITEAFTPLYDRLLRINPAVKILLTVSPVRHLKETLELNSVSKSVLRVACNELQERFPAAAYFPAYEIMLDDLRDYRFYKADMLHPTELAEDYIWQKFKTAYFKPDFNKFTIEWDKIKAALAHKPFNPASAAHQQFLTKILAKLEAWQATVDCSAEMEQVKKQLL